MEAKAIMGIKFLSGSAAEAVAAGLRGGLVVVPSAPVLVDMVERPDLREAMLNADLAITDSGLMVLLWRLLSREKLERVSGLEYLKLLLQILKPESGNLKAEGSDPNHSTNPQVSGFRSQVSLAGGVFWVMPTAAARDRNLAWLRTQGFQTTVDDCYVAPQYPAEGALSDGELLTVIQNRKPAHIIIALGGGVQERLGWFLKQDLSQLPAPNSQLRAYNPGIHCIGAAIGFLSGEQVKIPMWVDYLYLGWLWRSISAPRKFVPRYWKAARLVPLMIRYGAKAPIRRNLKLES